MRGLHWKRCLVYIDDILVFGNDFESALHSLELVLNREHDNWDDLLPFMMLAYNTTVHTSTGFTPYRLVFGEECSLPGNLVHRELRPDPPFRDVGDYASWV